MIFLDTHCLVWLYQKNLEKFTKEGLRKIDSDSLFISPAVLLELEYLYEIKRISINGSSVVSWLEERIGLQTDAVSFLPISERAASLKWTRDPFDRLITAQALFHDAELLTKDKIILENYIRAVW